MKNLTNAVVIFFLSVSFTSCCGKTKAEAPEVEAPEVEAPEVEAPEVEAPEVEAPKLKTIDKKNRILFFKDDFTKEEKWGIHSGTFRADGATIIMFSAYHLSSEDTKFFIVVGLKSYKRIESLKITTNSTRPREFDIEKKDRKITESMEMIEELQIDSSIIRYIVNSKDDRPIQIRLSGENGQLTFAIPDEFVETIVEFEKKIDTRHGELVDERFRQKEEYKRNK